MNADAATLTDTSDMIFVHDVFRRALADAPGQIASVNDGDTVRAQIVAGYLGEVAWFLHAHHIGEDELLYPLLAGRAPEYDELFSRMETQHAAVAESIEWTEQAVEWFGKSGSMGDGAALAAACRSLLGGLAGHLMEEETEVLPIASRTVTPAEWGALPGHILSQYTGTRLWLVLGLVFEAMPDGMSAHVLANVPPPVSEMWLGLGAKAFDKEMAKIRAVAS